MAKRKDESDKNPKSLRVVRSGVDSTKLVQKQMSGFAEFLREYGVVALAVGFVFGAQVKSLVDAFTASILNPLVGLLLPGKGDLARKVVVLHSNNKTTVFAWGSFVATLISMILVSAIIYFVIKAFKLDKLKSA